MSQVDSFAVAGGLSGLATRQAFNGILDALATCSSGATEPNNPFAGMIWRDTSTTPAQFKVRNDGNTAWVSVLQAFGASAQGETFLAATTQAAQRTALQLKSAALADVIDEDDMASDSDTKVPTQQSVKAYVDANSSDWTETAPVATTSGTVFDFTSLPSGITEMELLFSQVSAAATGYLTVQIGTGGTPQTTGYSQVGANSAGSTSAGTGSFIIVNAAGASALISGRMKFTKFDGNQWEADHVLSVLGGGVATGAGVVTLSGALDNLRLSTASAATFDNGQIKLRYR